MLDTHHESEILDLYEIALLLNYERTSSEPRFRYTKLLEVASHELDFQTLLINTPIWTAHKGPKDGFVFQRMEPAVIADTGSREVPDLPSNMLPQIVYPLARDITQLAPDRLETIYWQARGHDSCFKSVAILQHFFDLYTTDPFIRIRLADGKEYFSSPSTRSIIEYELLTVQRLTIAVVLPENKAYATGSADQPRFKHAVVVFESHSYNGGVQTVLDLASMQFGDTGRGPGHSGKGTLVLESLDDYHNRLSSVAAGFRTTKISYHITPDPNEVNEAWMKKVAERAKERWENRNDHHWCGHCARPLANGPELKRCSACRDAYYCHREHQIKAWFSHHKRWCGKP
ncbi:hypothetical protein DFH05DRAFT_175024 [Lentinula detonsa]|uniref:MYND-type domain-containing protein n=1 Tax=Lentinula detonsa TaxID=2804962 RepID=A0A9W8PCB2_9AGAR|nr:hypothetical protein DFH05DRAFT_175024 [Lentinula detonsa]